MLNSLIRIFHYDVHTYEVNDSKQAIANKLEVLFAKKKGLFKSPNLTGHFVEYPDSFFMTPKWSFAHIRNFETDPAYLKGIIFDTVNDRTKIEIAVRRNSVLLIVLVGFLIAAIGRLYKFFADKEPFIKLLPALFGGIFVLGLLTIIARYLTRSTRSSFERYLEISPTKGA